NISWTHVTPYRTFLWDSLNPKTMQTVDTYRPAGALFYRLAYSLFGLWIPGYRLMAHVLHFVNCLLVYSLIRKFHCGKLSSFMGGLIFVFQLFTLPIYWEFSTIFDLACAFFMYASFLLYLHSSERNHDYLSLAASAVFFFFAVRTKEMAFVLPLLFTIYELML